MKTNQDGENSALQARRRFLANCGKFAVVTPPVVSLMLSVSQRSYAAVGSGGSRGRGPQGNNGFGNGGGDGVPGNSGKEDTDR